MLLQRKSKPGPRLEDSVRRKNTCLLWRARIANSRRWNLCWRTDLLALSRPWNRIGKTASGSLSNIVPNKAIERHPAVLADDLPAIYSFIAVDNPAAADRVLNAIDDTFRQIASHPECGVLFRSRNPNLQRVRMLPVRGFQDYLVFYRDTERAIRILYVVHGARHLLRFFRSEPRE
jgi:toxin ParE1/3/4